MNADEEHAERLDAQRLDLLQMLDDLRAHVVLMRGNDPGPTDEEDATLGEIEERAAVWLRALVQAAPMTAVEALIRK